MSSIISGANHGTCGEGLGPLAWERVEGITTQSNGSPPPPAPHIPTPQAMPRPRKRIRIGTNKDAPLPQGMGPAVLPCLQTIFSFCAVRDIASFVSTHSAVRDASTAALRRLTTLTASVPSSPPRFLNVMESIRTIDIYGEQFSYAANMSSDRCDRNAYDLSTRRGMANFVYRTVVPARATIRPDYASSGLTKKRANRHTRHIRLVSVIFRDSSYFDDMITYGRNVAKLELVHCNSGRVDYPTLETIVKTCKQLKYLDISNFQNSAIKGDPTDQLRVEKLIYEDSSIDTFYDFNHSWFVHVGNDWTKPDRVLKVRGTGHMSEPGLISWNERVLITLCGRADTLLVGTTVTKEEDTHCCSVWQDVVCESLLDRNTYNKITEECMDWTDHAIAKRFFPCYSSCRSSIVERAVFRNRLRSAIRVTALGIMNQ